MGEGCTGDGGGGGLQGVGEDRLVDTSMPFIPYEGKIRAFDWLLGMLYNVVHHAEKLYTTLQSIQCHECQ